MWPILTNLLKRIHSRPKNFETKGIFGKKEMERKESRGDSGPNILKFIHLPLSSTLPLSPSIQTQGKALLLLYSHGNLFKTYKLLQQVLKH